MACGCFVFLSVGILAFLCLRPEAHCVLIRLHPALFEKKWTDHNLPIRTCFLSEYTLPKLRPYEFV